jgi:hypothetical protein
VNVTGFTDEVAMDDMTPFRRTLGERISVAVSKFKTKAAAAQAAGVTDDQLAKWRAGTVKVPVEGLYRLSTESGTDFAWLVTGTESVAPLGRRLQEQALRDVLTALAEVMQQDGVTFAPEKFANLVLTLHDELLTRRAAGNGIGDVTSMKNIISLAGRSR